MLQYVSECPSFCGRVIFHMGFPGDTSVKESACQRRRCKRYQFSPLVGKIPWRRKMATHSSVLPGEFHGQRSLVGCGLCGLKRVGHDWATEHTIFHIHPLMLLLDMDFSIFLAIVNNAAMNIVIHISVWVSVFSSFVLFRFLNDKTKAQTKQSGPGWEMEQPASLMTRLLPPNPTTWAGSICLPPVLLTTYVCVFSWSFFLFLPRRILVPPVFPGKHCQK